MAEEAALLSDDDLDLLDEEEIEHRRELAAVISNMKTQLSNFATEKREQDIKGLESLVRDVLDDVAAADELERSRTDSMPSRRPERRDDRSSGRPDTRTAITNLMGDTDGEDLTDHEHEEDGSMYENRSGLGEDMKFLASMPELCGQSLIPGASLSPLSLHACLHDVVYLPVLGVHAGSTGSD